MKTYAQFKTKSTGYVNGTMPPQFNKDNIKPIDLLGSDGVYILDSRFNLDNMIIKTHEIWSKHINRNNIIGFEIIRGNTFADYSKLNEILYSSLK